MVAGIDDNKAGKSPGSEDLIVSEFGPVELDWFDLSRKYRGAVFRLSTDAAKQISETLSFSANFELPAIRTAYVDLFELQGNCLIEIERNTKPTDLAVRYSRERWNPLDAGGKSGEGMRPLIKTEYRAKLISENVIALVSEQLRISPEHAQNFVLRINFKDKTFGVICEERFAEQIPSGGFSLFVLPNEAMLAGSDSTQIRTDIDDSLRSGVAARDRSDAELLNESAARSNSLDSASKDGTTKEEAAAEISANSKSSNKEDKGLKEPEGLPGSTSTLEKFIQGKEDTQVEKDEQRRETMESSSAKYATYSRSEVDQMLKQQAETVASALGSKISSQQRVFQEAVERQEKAFAKLSDNFVAQFDQTRGRLENASKLSEDTIHKELESFKAQLGKELEQYRAQINKTVVPVAKFIEEKNTSKPASTEKAAKEAPAKAQAQSSSMAENNGIRAMLIVNIVLMVLTLAALFAIFMPVVSKVEELEIRIDKVLTMRATTSSQSTEIHSNSDKGVGAGSNNLNGAGDSAHTITPSGSSN